MTMSLRVNTFRNVCHHVKRYMGCVVTEHLQLTDLREAHNMQLELVFDIAQTMTAISTHHRLVSAL